VTKKIFLFIWVILTFSSVSYSQGWLTEENAFETNWNCTFQIGPTLFIGELKKDFSGFTNDMNNQSDIGYSFQLAKMVWERVDIGFYIGVTNFRGHRENPSDINLLVNSAIYNSNKSHFMSYPIYYDTDILDFSFYSKYNFINFSSFTSGYIKLNLYTKVGFGVIFISSELGYKNRANYTLSALTYPLFTSRKKKNAHLSLSPSFGMNYQLSDRVFISAEASFQLMNVDYIDGILNLSDDLTPEIDIHLINEYRVPVFGLTSKFMLGITYFFNFDSQRQTRAKAFPWYFNRYRSYYSKFQTPSTKRARQERLPFYNIKFEE
jgi:hypothetical protein